jgi:hypothetical protein
MSTPLNAPNNTAHRSQAGHRALARLLLVIVVVAAVAALAAFVFYVIRPRLAAQQSGIISVRMAGETVTRAAPGEVAIRHRTACRPA